MYFFLLSLLLLAALVTFLNTFDLVLVGFQVVEDRSLSLKLSEDVKHFQSFSHRDLLSVSAHRDRLVFIKSVLNILEVRVSNVLDIEPVDREAAWPFLGGGPAAELGGEIDR